MSIISISKQFRADVLRNDRQILQQLSKAYGSIDRSLRLQLNSLLRDIADAQSKGITINQDWLRQSFRYQQLIRQVNGQVQGYTNGVNLFVRTKQSQAVELGQQHATDLIMAAMPEITFARLPTGAISELVGQLQNGSPLSGVLNRLGGQASKDVKNALVNGLASGYGPAKIAQDIRSAIDVPRWKALQIARTEVLRAYRQSTLDTYAENSDVLDGWIWTASLSMRTCAACWALNGQFFPLTTTFFPSHVSCRCTSIPSVKGVKSNMQSGEEAFAMLPVDQQETILGPTRLEMYQQGASLMDFVIRTRDSEWGGAYQVRPLYQMKKRKRAA